jgi:hypothetical protein
MDPAGYGAKILAITISVLAVLFLTLELGPSADAWCFSLLAISEYGYSVELEVSCYVNFNVNQQITTPSVPNIAYEF